MAEITAMRETAERGTWIPSQMKDNSVPPKIASFGPEHAPSLLYAELLRKYTSGQLPGVTNQWYEGQGISGYFCQHDGFVSFVLGTQDLISNQNRLTQILAQFKSNYGKVFATQQPITAKLSPPTEPTEQQLAYQQTLQSVANKLKQQGTLTVSALLKFQPSIELFTKKTSILGVQAAPHVHRYNEPGFASRVFCYNDIFIVCDALNDMGSTDEMLFRPHAYLLDVDRTMLQDYLNTKPTKKLITWEPIKTTIIWANGQHQEFTTNDFSVHNGEVVVKNDTNNITDVRSSYINPIIGTFNDFLKNGPFVSEITSPDKYKKKTLHILFNDIEKIPDTTEELILYLSALPIDQQKFIIRQLFPFLVV